MPRVAGWPPRWLTPATVAERKRGDGAEFVKFMEGHCRADKQTVAAQRGDLLVARPWQRLLTSHIFARRADNRLKHRQALVGIARKNAKSGIASAISLDGLVFGPQGGQVFCMASSKDQAKIVFGATKSMVQMDPELNDLLITYKDAIENPATGSVLRPTSADAPLLEGLNPTLAVYDEVHTAPNRELWDVFALAGGARADSLLLGITTAGVRYDRQGRDSHCYTLYEYGKAIVKGEVEDPTFFLAWWEPKNPNADHRDPKVWREGNPGFGDLNNAEDFDSAVIKTPENEFRTKRLNQWVTKATAWLPHGTWDGCLDSEATIADGVDVVLAFDGSHNNDTTALVAVTCEETPMVALVALWEKPIGDPTTDWKVNIADVEDAVREACRRWNVKEVACDPYRWQRSLQELEAEGLPMAEFPQSPSRMTPATQGFYEAVVNKQLRHGGDPALARHLGNAVIRTDARGTRISKEHHTSNRKIDAAVAAVMALARAQWWHTELSKPTPRRAAYGFRF